MFCPKCGHKQETITKSCEKCGVIFAKLRLPGAATAAAQPAPPPPPPAPKSSPFVAIVAGLLFLASLALGYLYSQQKTEIATLQAQLDTATTELASMKAATVATGNYEELAISMLRSIATSAADAESVCGEIKKRWSQAITDRKDINEAIRSALNAKNHYVSALKEHREKIAAVMPQLKNPPENMRAVHMKLIALYGQYEKYVNMAVSPSGSLLSYNQEEDSTNDELLRLIKETSVMTGI